jgi:hypothetical protein
LFYDGKRKVVPIDFLETYLSPFALAVWIMDDGAIDEVRDLGTLIEFKYNVPATVNFDKGKPRLRFAESGMNQLLKHVRQHIHPSMLYKLRRDRAPSFNMPAIVARYQGHMARPECSYDDHLEAA